MVELKMDPAAAPILYLDGITVSFDGFRALNNLSFYVEPGEMRAVIGPNGAGKTTMMDVVTGRTRPDAGDVIFRGEYNLAKLDETRIANLGIGRKFQKPTVFENHTVFGNLELALHGGEDYVLLFTAPAELMDTVMPQLPEGAAVLGEITAGEPGQVSIVDPSGAEMVASRGGWDHYR